MDVPVAANVLGILGAVCWSIQLIPQIIINYRRHNATGLQPSMMMLWAWAGLPLGVYNIVNEFNIALRIQPQILTTLSLTTWIQCYYYERKWSILQALLVVFPISIVMGGVQAGLILGLRVAKHRHVDWPMTTMAVLSALLLALGVLRHYWDIWIHRTVRGISFIFVAIDAAGDLFSLISVFFQPTLDVKGMVIYGTELVLWLGVFACGGYFNFLPWLRKVWSNHHPEPPVLQPISETNHPAMESHCVPSIATHDLPSSTSVFRTPSGDISGARPRNAQRLAGEEH